MHARGVECRHVHRALGVVRGLGERVEHGLPPCGPLLLGHDRGDDVDQLGARGGTDPVAVLEQRDHQRAFHHGVRGRVDVLQQVRCLRPGLGMQALAGRGLPLGLLLVPDVRVPHAPFVEAQRDVVIAVMRGLGRIGAVGHGGDEAGHVLGGGQVVLQTLGAALVVVGVAGDEVQIVVGPGEHRALPGAEGRRMGAGRAAGHQFQPRLGEFHGVRHLVHGQRVLLGHHVADLPGAVHLVADAPHADAHRFGDAVGHAAVRQFGTRRAVNVFQLLQGGLEASGAHVHGEHDLGAGALAPSVEVVDAYLVGFGAVPGQVAADGAVLAGAGAVLPVVVRHEVAAGVAHAGHAELPDQVEHVGAEALIVGGGVVGVVDAAVDAAAEVLDERAEQAARHIGCGADALQGGGGVGRRGRGGAIGHGNSFVCVTECSDVVSL